MIDRFYRRARLMTLYSGAALGTLGTTPAHADEAAAAVSAAAAPSATDADAGAAAEEDSGTAIVVTARRRVETAQDVPIALSVIGGEALQRSGNYNINQLQQLVPSLQVINSNPRNTVINIRGLGANTSIAVDGLEYGTGFYVDGVYYARPGQSQFDLVDLERIEVLRGPQGTLFGKNTTAGAINITTREPDLTKPDLVAEGWLGDYAFHQIRASGSIPIIADKVAVRLTLSDTHRDGFLVNVFDGRDAQDYDNFSVRGQLLIKPAEDLKIRIIGDYSKQKQRFMVPLIDGYFANYANGQKIANNIFDRAARLGHTLPTSDAFSRVVDVNSPFQANMASYGVSGEATWDLGRATLTSITAYRWWDWYPKNDSDALPYLILLQNQQQNFQRQFSQELRIASNGTNKIDYVAGLFYFRQVIRGYGATQYGSDYGTWTLPTGTPTATLNNYDLAFTNFEADSYSDPRTKSYAAFGQADWHVTDALTFTGGLRFTHENKTGSFSRFQIEGSGLDLSGLSPAQLAAVLAIRNTAAFQLTNIPTTSAKLDSNALSGLATLSWKITPDALLYATYSRGSKSGGLNVTAGGLTPDGRSLRVVKPEKVNAYEIGLKSQLLDRKVTFNLAAFLTEVTDYQTTIVEPVGQIATISYIANIPKVRSKGVEADLAYSPAPGITFTASGAYTDARSAVFTNSPQKPENSNPGTLQLQDLSGKRLPNVSKFAYTLGVDASRPINETLEVYGRADWLHRSSFNSTATLSAYGRIPAYGILNARIGLRRGPIDVSIWARNLLDQDYYVTRTPATTGLTTAILGDPRTVGGTVRVTL